MKKIPKELIDARDKLPVKKDSRFYWANEWREFRRLYIEWHGEYCDECSSTENLQLHHHKGHNRLLRGEVSVNGDWRLLCFTCHDNLHGNRMSLQNENKVLRENWQMGTSG